jgi:hypothetical protein
MRVCSIEFTKVKIIKDNLKKNTENINSKGPLHLRPFEIDFFLRPKTPLLKSCQLGDTIRKQDSITTPN